MLITPKRPDCCDYCGQPKDAETRAEAGEALARVVVSSGTFANASEIRAALVQARSIVLPLCAVETCGHVKAVHVEAEEPHPTEHRRKVFYCESCLDYDSKTVSLRAHQFVGRGLA